MMAFRSHRIDFLNWRNLSDCAMRGVLMPLILLLMTTAVPEVQAQEAGQSAGIVIQPGHGGPIEPQGNPDELPLIASFQDLQAAEAQPPAEADRPVDDQFQAPERNGNLPEIAPAPAPRRQEQEPDQPETAPAPDAEDQQETAAARPYTGTPSYAEVYNSIPFSRAEFEANPNYRHEATIELLLGQVRPKHVYHQNIQPVMPGPMHPSLYTYLPPAYSNAAIPYIPFRYRNTFFNYGYNLSALPPIYSNARLPFIPYRYRIALGKLYSSFPYWGAYR